MHGLTVSVEDGYLALWTNFEYQFRKHWDSSDWTNSDVCIENYYNNSYYKFDVLENLELVQIIVQFRIM